ncbi:pyruvate carboxylase [Abditibacterium utsteinense]|uniref:Pyruvate carboxylase n=1 Tax=Abditibacterium utsteinense TaxID=1960156 RepID=A0A2S8SST5_9BACT|nr:pyruvate carboxylase [Abditibacterium utsteinense]PQV63861.1 pyruvate carboxylase [Abditibacterium utsteinense]
MPKLLVANRSEIAIRVFRAASELGLKTVAIYAPEDRFSTHRFKADEAYELEDSKGPVGAYLDIPGIIALAKAHEVDLIHPGYGFLSENAGFARACQENGITFVGPRPELLEMMGDKVAARALAQKVGVRVLPGTEEPISDRAEAMQTALEIGFPLIIKAAAGGGGRGMRVVLKSEDLDALLSEAQDEAGRAFGDSSVFLERYVPRAKHIEVQILGDKHGNCLHLYERDCSVQRRHQKVVEIAPSVNLDETMRRELCDAARALSASIGYDNAGTVEFLVDVEAKEWFFIEMNPRIQVEHTVTEQITGIDLVRSQILIAQGFSLESEELALPSQNEIPRNGYAIQARITTEDPEKNFAPDYGKILAYRSAAGFGIRLDGGMADAGAVVTPFYDSLLVKVTASAPTFATAISRLDRALREFRIRGVKTNIPFIENVLRHPIFASGEATTTLIDTTPELFQFEPRRDRATKLLNFLGDVIVNGNPNAKGWKPEKPFATARVPVVTMKNVGAHGNAPLDSDAEKGALPCAPTSRQILLEKGPRGFAEWTKSQTQLLVTDTTLRDAHQSLLATRVRTFDMLRIADAIQNRAPNLFSLEMWGGATFDTAMRFGREDPWERLRMLREKIPHICFQMLFRGSNAVGYSNYPDNVVAGFVKHAAQSGMDIFRVFDSLNYLPNLQVAMDAINQTGTTVCEAAICYTGDILDPSRDKYPLQYYVNLAKELEKMGAHFLAIKDMAGLCRPYAAHKLVATLKQEIGLPIHFHTHDTSGTSAASVLQASDAGVDVVDLALASMSGGTSQPNLNSVVAALQHTPRDTKLDLDALNEFSDYWEAVLPFYQPFDTTSRAGTAEVYIHEMPGGQYTNLKEQANGMGLGARWPEIARTYAEVNQLFGDIVKVTPSSKVVGDLTMMLIARGLKASDVPNLEPGAVSFPESVIDMLRGGLGQPLDGFPEDVQRVVLNGIEPLKNRPGAGLEPLDLQKMKEELGENASDDDLYSHLMYPQVQTDFAAFKEAFGDVSTLPTPAYFYGLQPDEEISVSIEAGKTLIIRLINIGEANKDGARSVNFELNGIARSVLVDDKSLAGEKKLRLKADATKENEVGAPIPGMVTQIAVSVGQKIERGERLLTIEAMKMLTVVNAPIAGTVEEIAASVGETVDAKDLLLRISA